MADQNQNKTPKPENERPSILRRIAIILGILIGFLIYSYGWTVTEIDLGVPQEAQRQENVQIALRELLSPRILQQERDVTILSAPFLMACDEGESPDQADPGSGDAVVVLDPACGDSGDEITVQVYNGQTNADARVRWMPPPGEGETEEDVRPRPREILETEREELVLNGNGRFTGTIEVPLIRGGDGQLHQVQVQVAVPAGPIQLSETAILVIDRMAQTIFMALVATTVAIPIAVVLSFIAARNLMQRVRLTVGSMLLAFITFVLGIALGNTVLGPLGRLGFTVGRGDIGGDLGALVAFVVPLVWVVGVVYIIRTLNPVRIEKRHVETALWRQTLNTVVIVIGAMFAVGALGGLGLLGGEQVRLLGENLQPEGAVGPSGWLARLPGVLVVAVGNLLTILGALVELGISLIASVLLGAMFAGISSNLVGTWLRRVPDSLGTALGVLLGAFSGSILMALMGVFGLWASLLGLLPPLIAAIMGGNLLIIALTTFLPANTARQLRNQEAVRWVIFFAGATVVFLWAFGALDIGRALVDGTLPSQTQVQLFGTTLPVTRYVFNAIVVGGVLGAALGGLTGVKGTFPLGNLLYNTSRTLLNVVRSIEPLIMGLVFVVWVGIGPFAGVLALTLHSVAALGKLYSEQIENIDPGPLEALQSTGANQLQTIVYAVIPQIVPPYIAFTMYRWDINVRMSTIIGFVGGGGIGLLLQQQINLLRYRDAGVAVLAIAIVVSILDFASASIRERIT